MKKLFLTFGIVFSFIASTFAQNPNALPLNPKVKSGVLPNGLSYYILHNEEPKDRANFYIAQKVGSTLETPEQLGLAHFLEHMAFNGTTNYPGDSMLKYLQSKGIRFGADINATTGFDETIYHINNVVTTDKNLMDSVLLVLHDWSGEILLEEAEIDAERGVIQEEWRSRNNANFRMLTDVLPKIYQEYQYQQSPIGKMDVIMNFKPEVLRAYYKKWYRPDLQGIVIVGDFDAAEMERKVVDLFSTIIMPENAAPREYPTVSDNEKPIFASFSDPELTSLLTLISFKDDKMPRELRNTFPGYMTEQIIEPLVAHLINNRLNEFSQTPECKYVFAGVNFGNYWVSKTKASFDLQVIAKNDSREAVEDALSVVVRACKTGFNEVEYERAANELMAGIEKLYNERDKTDNSYLGKELCNYFIENDATPGIEAEYQIWHMVVPNLPVAQINEFASHIISNENIVVVTSAPKADGFELVGEEAMLSTIQEVINAEYEALEEEKITDPLISSLPAPGQIVSSVEDSALKATVLTLSNGVKVVVKPTDYSADEVLMYAFRDGGKRIYDASQADNVLVMQEVYEDAKLGNFDLKTLRKYLSGKNVSLGFNVGDYNEELNGMSTVKDLPTFFELLYATFAELNPDEEAFNVNVNRYKPLLENAEKNPTTILKRETSKTRYDNNALMLPLSAKTLENANYNEAFTLLKEALGNPLDYTFVFVGNIDPAVFNPLLEQYLASLPTHPVEVPVYKTEIKTAQGQVVNEFKQPMETPATIVFDVYSQGNLDFTIPNDIMVDLVGSIIRSIYIETLREEEGGTYSPSATSFYDAHNGEWNIIYTFSTNADQQQKLIARANDELLKLLKDGATEEKFNRAKEAMIKQYEINSRKNNYWTSILALQLEFPQVDYVNGFGEALQNITLLQFNEFMRNLYNGENRIQVIMEGVAAQ